MRHLKSIFSSLLFFLVIQGCGGQSYTDFVNPMVGTDGTGHTYPGAILPFGMVSASPDTHNSGWAHCSGYHYDDTNIMGFSQTHMHGTGAEDMGDLMIMPLVGEPIFYPGPIEDPNAGYRSRFSHNTEVSHPGYYAVTLDDYSIRCEMTVTDRCPFYRFSYPKGENAGLLFDMTHGVGDRTTACEAVLVNERSVKGFRRSSGFVSDHIYYFWAEFSEPVKESVEGPEEGKLYVSFNNVGEVLVKMGVSTVSEEAAKKNLHTEIRGWNFDKIAMEADKKWNEYLDIIDVQSIDEDSKIIFYTALYHSMIVPNLINDVDGCYRGWDSDVHKSNSDMYTNYSLWDTYRAVHPLFNILCPERNVSFINSMLEGYKQTGQLPINQYGTCETYCMIGYHSVSVIADAIMQDLKGFDYELAYEAMTSIALDDARGVGYMKRYGYIPSELESNSVSKLLEYAYDDWCISIVATKLGKTEDATYFADRALMYRNALDPETLFMRGRHANGTWRTPFDPAETSGLGQHDFTEGNSWQYSFYVPHDMTRYIELVGGEEVFESRLDRLFNEQLEGNEVPDITGLIGQYAHGNEPSHHVAYLYNFVGKPWKTQEMVSRIKEKLYTSGPEGLCGNDDCGQMSAWYVLSALGFYPVTPAMGYFVIGSPSVKHAEISLTNGKKFIIKAPKVSKENIYIQSVKLNGKPYSKSYIEVNDIMNGATIEFDMGSAPDKNWAVLPEDRPVALIQK